MPARNEPQLADQSRGMAAPGAFANAAVASAAARPVLPPGVPERFLACRSAFRPGETLVYRPAVLGTVRLHFVDARADVDHWEDVALLCPVEADASDVAWEEADRLPDAPEFDESPAADARFTPPPALLTRPKTYDSLDNALKNHLYREHRLALFKCGLLKETSRPGESEGDFRVRLVQAAHEHRDLEVEKLRNKYAPKLATLQDRIRRAQQKVEKEKVQASQQTWQAALSFGTSILGALFGRKLASRTNVSRAATSMRAAGRAASARGDITHAEESLEAVQQKLTDLEAEFEAETKELEALTRPDHLELSEFEVKPRKSDININRVALAWVPWRVDASGIAEPAYQ